jgi:hypothetical protein
MADCSYRLSFASALGKPKFVEFPWIAGGLPRRFTIIHMQGFIRRQEGPEV